MKTLIVDIPDKDEQWFSVLFNKFRVKNRILSNEEKENLWLAKMIDEAEEEGGEVREEEVMKIFKRNGVKI